MARSSAQTLHIARSAFIDVLRRYPQGAIGVAILISRRVARLFRFVEMASHRSLTERVSCALRRLGRRNGESGLAGTAALKFTRAEPAKAASVLRQRARLELWRLQSQGLVGLSRGTIVAKPDRLCGAGRVLTQPPCRSPSA